MYRILGVFGALAVLSFGLTVIIDSPPSGRAASAVGSMSQIHTSMLPNVPTLPLRTTPMAFSDVKFIMASPGSFNHRTIQIDYTKPQTVSGVSGALFSFNGKSVRVIRNVLYSSIKFQSPVSSGSGPMRVEMWFSAPSSSNIVELRRSVPTSQLAYSPNPSIPAISWFYCPDRILVYAQREVDTAQTGPLEVLGATNTFNMLRELEFISTSVRISTPCGTSTKCIPSYPKPSGTGFMINRMDINARSFEFPSTTTSCYQSNGLTRNCNIMYLAKRAWCDYNYIDCVFKTSVA